MIAALFAAQRLSRDEAAAFARRLEFGPARTAHHHLFDHLVLAQTSPRGSAWVPGCARSGRQALLNGQLHNRARLAAELGIPDRDSASIYAEAVDAWGAFADDKAIGHYCAISTQPGDAGMRLARSPFQAPPLHFRAAGARLIASSTARSLFFGDEARRQPDPETLARRLLIDFTEPRSSVWQSCGRVPLGSVLTLDNDSVREVWRYDIARNPKIRLPRDEDYVAAALALLDEGVAAAIEGAQRPGILLTGGLDSASVAVSALRQMPDGRDLRAFTYGPEEQWQGQVPPGQYAREFAAVARLAELHPRLKPEFFTSPGQDHRHGQRELIAAIDGATPALGLAWMFHDVFERARALDCDVMLCADWGNDSFSSAAKWGYAEYFLRGRWVQLWRGLKGRHADPRPLWRRFLAWVVMPLLPRPLWRLMQAIRGKHTELWRRSGLSPDWLQRHRLDRKARAAGLDFERLPFSSRAAYWRRIAEEDGQDLDELDQALEQLYGVPKRDPSAYRPLVEFCYGLPTDQFLRNGIDRWLARRMAEGRLPDEQRLNPAIGGHSLDWHLRIGRVRGELIDELDRMAADPDIAAMIDLPRLRKLLTEFPAEDTSDLAIALPYLTAIPMGMSAARFIAYAKGRNDI